MHHRYHCLLSRCADRSSCQCSSHPGPALPSDCRSHHGVRGLRTVGTASTASSTIPRSESAGPRALVTLDQLVSPMQTLEPFASLVKAAHRLCDVRKLVALLRLSSPSLSASGVCVTCSSCASHRVPRQAMASLLSLVRGRPLTLSLSTTLHAEMLRCEPWVCCQSCGSHGVSTSLKMPLSKC
jgi:hypothetical protein